MTLTAISAFAGVGGFDLALSRCGVRVTAAIEIDDAARGVLAHRFPATTLFADIREVAGEQVRETGFDPRRGILAGGWPCQDHSLAGRRAGFAGDRSSLFAELVRLAEDLRPRWLFFENVPGLLSSGSGADMGHVLQKLVALGYGVAWRVLDAQHFGVPQRRRRVLLVGCLGNWDGPEQVLLEPESGVGHPAPRRPARPRAPRASAESPAGGGRAYGLSASTPDVAGPLGASRGGHRIDLDTSGAYVTTVLGDVAHTLTAEGHDAGEDGTGRGVPIVTYPVALRGRTGGTQLEVGEAGEPAFALRAASGGSSQAMVAVTGCLTARYGRGPDSTVSTPLVTEEAAVRRLTPRECERLQGFPDDWTLYSDGREQSDSARYRQMGNAVPVPVIEWIGRRMVAVDAAV